MGGYVNKLERFEFPMRCWQLWQEFQPLVVTNRRHGYKKSHRRLVISGQ